MNKLLVLTLCLCVIGTLAVQKPMHSRFKSKANASKVAFVERDDHDDDGAACDGVCCGDYGHCEHGECVCQDGWLDAACDRVDPCFGTDCGANGKCHDNGDHHVCYCHDGYSGATCEFLDAECVGAWSEWRTCSDTCGGGAQSKTFIHSTLQSGYGCHCKFPNGETRTQACNTHECPIDCESHYSDWGSCSVTCAEGTHTRNLIVEVPAQFGGKECPAETETEGCNDRECPIDCVGEWSEFDTCSTTCDEGIQFKTFNISVQAEYGGIECEAGDKELFEQACNLGDENACPIHCEGSFDEFTACSTTCADGIMTRTFDVAVADQFDGIACKHEDDYVDTEVCNLGGCPVDCVGKFTEYNECTETCGENGTQQRTFEVSVEEVYGGAECKFPAGKTEDRDCNRWACPSLCDGVCCENGHCEEGTCVCYHGYTGTLCDEEL